METAEFLTALDREGRSLIAAAGNAGPDAEVPSCPGWRVRDLIRHQGAVHRWATGFVAGARERPGPMPDDPVPDAELSDWFRQGHRSLLDALHGADDDVRCWTFLPGAASPLAFWARRQTHETTIHRIDAEQAEGHALSPVPRHVAADGIDELLTGFHARERSRVRSERPLVVRVRATDTDEECVWTARITDRPVRAVRGAQDEPDCEISGPAEVLYLALWNRTSFHAGVEVTGDRSVVELWQRTSAIG